MKSEAEFCSKVSFIRNQEEEEKVMKMMDRNEIKDIVQVKTFLKAGGWS